MLWHRGQIDSFVGGLCVYISVCVVVWVCWLLLGIVAVGVRFWCGFWCARLGLVWWPCVCGVGVDVGVLVAAWYCGRECAVLVLMLVCSSWPGIVAVRARCGGGCWCARRGLVMWPCLRGVRLWFGYCCAGRGWVRSRGVCGLGVACSFVSCV